MSTDSGRRSGVASSAEAGVAWLTSTVRFAESLSAMSAAGITTFVHVGPGEVTAGMARRTVPGARVLTVSSVEDVAAVAAELNVQ